MLRRGDEGPEVGTLQKRLAGLGYVRSASHDPERYFGLYTEAAVRAEQRRGGLAPDGIVGPATDAWLLHAAPLVTLSGDPIAFLLGDALYLSQRVNPADPYTTCNVTSLAVRLDHSGVRPAPGRLLAAELHDDLQGPEAQAELARGYPWAVTAGIPAREVHGMLDWAAARRGVGLRTVLDGTWAQVRGELDAGPVIAAGKFTAAGHIVCVVGETVAGDVVVHDPWGDWRDGAGSYAPDAHGTYDGSFRVYGRAAWDGVTGGDGHRVLHLTA